MENKEEKPENPVPTPQETEDTGATGKEEDKGVYHEDHPQEHEHHHGHDHHGHDCGHDHDHDHDHSHGSKPSQSKEFMNSIENFMRNPKNQEQVKQFKKKASLYQPHTFWDTQPVIHLAKDKPETQVGPIETRDLKEVKTTPYTLPEGFEWCIINLHSDEQMQEVFELLRDNYVEDSDNMFRFKYAIAFLKWALATPKYSGKTYKDWIMGCRVTKNKKLVGFISGIPTMISVDGQTRPMAEINFLCVHKKLRTKRLAPVLIKEVTRRVNLTDTWQAIYTAGRYLPTPFSEALYYHRLINIKKLVDINFCSIPQSLNLRRFEKLNKMNEMPKLPGFRRMVNKDAKQVHELLNSYLSKFKIHQEFSLDEVSHFLTPKKDIVDTYVVEETNDKGEKVITDFISYYTLPSSVLQHKTINEMKAAYLYYYTANKQTLETLVKAALVLARETEHDVFNCLNIMDNKEFLENLKFGPGNGNLMFYLFNYRTQSMGPENIGMVLV